MARRMQHLSSVLIPLCGEFGLSQRMRLDALRAKWHEIFGEPLSSHCYPASMEKGSLLVNVDSPIWLQELRFAKTEFERKLKEFSVDVVRFRHGRTLWGSLPRNKPDKCLRQVGSPLTTEDCTSQNTAWIESLTDTISDPELRCLIRKTIERSLTKKAAG